MRFYEANNFIYKLLVLLIAELFDIDVFIFGNDLHMRPVMGSSVGGHRNFRRGIKNTSNIC